MRRSRSRNSSCRRLFADAAPLLPLMVMRSRINSIGRGGEETVSIFGDVAQRGRRRALDGHDEVSRKPCGRGNRKSCCGAGGRAPPCDDGRRACEARDEVRDAPWPTFVGPCSLEIARMPGAPMCDRTGGALSTRVETAQLGAERDDSVRVQRPGRLIAALDVRDVDGFKNAGRSQHTAEIGVEIWIVDNASKIALEEAVAPAHAAPHAEAADSRRLSGRSVRTRTAPGPRSVADRGMTETNHKKRAA